MLIIASDGNDGWCLNINFCAVRIHSGGLKFDNEKYLKHFVTGGVEGQLQQIKWIWWNIFQNGRK